MDIQDSALHAGCAPQYIAGLYAAAYKLTSCNNTFSAVSFVYRMLFTVFTTFSTVNPNFSNSWFAGADAPKPCIVT